MTDPWRSVRFSVVFAVPLLPMLYMPAEMWLTEHLGTATNWIMLALAVPV